MTTTGDTIMHAAGVGDFELLVRLIEADADVNELDSGSTALMIAVEEDYAREVFVKYLLEHGADPNIPNVDGDSPLDIARYHKDAATVDLLLSHGAKGKDGPSTKEVNERAYIDGMAEAHRVITNLGGDSYF
jgi:ankyrin repeat protein